MNLPLKIFPISCLILFVCNHGLFAQEANNNKTQSGIPVAEDTLNFQVFDNEREFSLFLAEDMNLFENESDSLTFGQSKKDSLHLALNRDKKIVIPKKHLIEFSDFILSEPEVKKIMVQTVDLFPKDKLVKYTFEVTEGDYFFLKFNTTKGGLFGTQIEVLLNEVRVEQQMSLNMKKEFALEFLVAQSGKVDVVFRNFGFFKLQGDIEIDIKPRKEKIKIQQERLLQVYKNKVNVLVRDTLYQTLLNDPFTVSHSLNLKGNSVFQRQFKLPPEMHVIGLAIFLYPFEEKEKLEFQRREIYKEDPLQDFALKELIGKSYTYLPEFPLLNLDFSVSDLNYKNHWLNGQNQVSEGWKLSSNSKRNYAFFELKSDLSDNKINVKVINRSELYSYEMNLQMIVLFVESFSVIEEVEVKEFEDIIILTLI